MKYLSSSIARVVSSFAVALGASLAFTSYAVMQPTELVIQEINGTASYSVGGTWQPLTKDLKLASGAIIKTDADSTVDLLLPASATALRLTPNSTLRLDKLNKEAAGEMTISETSVTVLAGAVAGTQRKLASPSRFQINFATGAAHIVGTEYFVRADGAVSVVSGHIRGETTTVIVDLAQHGVAARLRRNCGGRARSSDSFRPGRRCRRRP